MQREIREMYMREMDTGPATVWGRGVLRAITIHISLQLSLLDWDTQFILTKN
jgi:hypothetical protein